MLFIILLWKGSEKCCVIYTQTFFLNIKDARPLSNAIVSDMKNLENLTEKDYKKTTKQFSIVTKNLELEGRKGWF